VGEDVGRRTVHGVAPHYHDDVTVAGDVLDLHFVRGMPDPPAAKQLQNPGLVVDDVQRRVHQKATVPHRVERAGVPGKKGDASPLLQCADLLLAVGRCFTILRDGH
jgi:hypothetical protein